MNFTFNSESYGTTVEINFEATTLDEIRDMFDQFLRGSGFHIVEDDTYKNPDTGNPCEGWDNDIKPWVGMSDVEIAAYSNVYDGIRLAKMIEAQLKERNT